MLKENFLAGEERTRSDQETINEKINPNADLSSFHFKVNLDLEKSGQFALLPGEETRAKWIFVSTAMSQAEWFATILTLGMYYIITRVLLQRKRKYAVYVTNKSVHVKEEMFEKQFFCIKLLMENQVTYPISSLGYVCAEEVGPRLCGLMPTKVACEMRFGRYPVDSQVPLTIYRSNLQIIFEPFTIASKFAFQNAFGINFDANPVQLVLQLLHAIPLMSVPYMWIIWAGFFGLSLLYQTWQVIHDMLFTALMDPSIGPRQAIGTIDATNFRLEADISEDPQCKERMRIVLEAIADALPNRHIVRSNVAPRANASKIQQIAIGEKMKQLNKKNKYEDNNEFVVPKAYLHFASDETIYDVCPTNPGWSSSDVKRMFMTFGLYYFTDIAGHINHRRNTYFTSHRIIQHSVLLEGSTVTHSRLDFWVADAFTNMAVVHFRKQCTFRATAKSFGWLSFEMRTHQKSFMTFLFRSLFRPRFEAAEKKPGKTFMSRDDWSGNSLLRDKSILTACALDSTNEQIDCAIQSPQRIFSWTEYLLSCCCLLTIPEASLTATDECLYVEQYAASSCFSKNRFFVVLPWCDVDGIYWQNFDAEGPTSFAYCGLLCAMCFVCLPLAFCACLMFCCGGCAGSPMNYDSYDDAHFGQKGSQIRICVKKSLSFRMGILLPKYFYGMQQATVNAIVDSIILRSLQHEIVRSRGGKGVAASDAIVIRDTEEITSTTTGNILSGVHQLTSQISQGQTGPVKPIALNNSEIKGNNNFAFMRNIQNQQRAALNGYSAKFNNSIVVQGVQPSNLHPMLMNNVVSASAPPLLPQQQQQPPIMTVQATLVSAPPASDAKVITAQPDSCDSAPIVVNAILNDQQEGFTNSQRGDGSIHFAEYRTIPPFRYPPQQNANPIGGTFLHFPMNPDGGNIIHRSVFPSEVFLRSWRIETSLIDFWTTIYYILTFGVGFFIHHFCHPFRTFTSVFVTPHRVLVQEEVFQMDYFCSRRIMENETSFKISDLSYVNVIEIGPRWFGLVPGKTLVEMRFGQHPRVTEDPPNIGSFPSNNSGRNTERNPFILATARATEEVYGIAQEVPKNPANVMHRYMQYAQVTNGLLWSTVLKVVFSAYFLKHCGSILGRMLLQALYRFFISNDKDRAVGPSTIRNDINGRVFYFRFATEHAPTLAAEFVQLISQLQATKVARLAPSSKLTPKNVGNEYNEVVKGQFPPINYTDKYGEDGGFNILKSLWELQKDEVVYDVLPSNPHINWSWTNIFYTIFTCGLYYFLYLLPSTRFKKSYLLSNRRMIRHVLRVTDGQTFTDGCFAPAGIMFSNLEMWFLAPIDSYTIIEEVKRSWLGVFTCGMGCCKRKDGSECCTREVLQFVTDSSRFGPFVFFVSNKMFMKTLLKVLSGGMKQNVLAAIALVMAKQEAGEEKASLESNYKNRRVWTKEDLSVLAAESVLRSRNKDFLTIEFINSLDNNEMVIERSDDVLFAHEIIEAAISATLPPTQKGSCCANVMSCCSKKSQTVLTLTNAGVYLEHWSGRNMRMLTYIPWPMIDGLYWSNFEAVNPFTLCRKNSATPVYGYPGSQLHLHVDGNTHFGISIQLPNRYFSGFSESSSNHEKKYGDVGVDIESGGKEVFGDVDFNQLVETLHRNIHRPWLQRHADLAADPRLVALVQGDEGAVDSSTVLALVMAKDSTASTTTSDGEEKSTVIEKQGILASYQDEVMER